MGIIVKEKNTGNIVFFMKGADVVMSKIVQFNDWLEEECGNMGREGLRTLVFGKKILTQEEYNQFTKRFSNFFFINNYSLDIKKLKQVLKIVI